MGQSGALSSPERELLREGDSWVVVELNVIIDAINENNNNKRFINDNKWKLLKSF